ncbi:MULTISPECIES: hypothetical protein [Sphingomonas]|uniref:hypothetical protein n=1 Tax=Sphingomonas TaxID=13687 RepID=UPI000DF0194E|nr:MULTISPECIES: hypothetical protein [Sphingomonas]
MRVRRHALLAGISLALAACSGGPNGLGGFAYYSLVRPNRVVAVGNGAMAVVSPREWNRASRSSFTDIGTVEDWTLNGPYLDSISFVSGLANDKRIIHQERKADRQVPRFRATMTPPEIASLLESLYRIEGGAIEWRTLNLAPRPFLGAAGFQYDYEHLDSDELWRKGRAVGAVIDGRLYLIQFDAARSHYYAAALPDFEAMVVSARRR